MAKQYANAYPKKSFFIDTFTRDLSLEDCILDLIDNSIDGLIRTQSIDPTEISKTIFSRKSPPKVSTKSLPAIEVNYGPRSVEILDKCGGIDRDYAMNEAFNFGHGPKWEGGHLGVYGIGLKRALFKIGNKFSIESKTTKNGFTCKLDVREWIRKDEKLEDWRFPIEDSPAANKPEQAGTAVRITNLRKEVKMRLQDGTVDANLVREIGRTYAFFLGRYVQVILNGTPVSPIGLPLSRPKKQDVSFEELQFEKSAVTCRIYASLAAPDDKGRWPAERAGWYVACNGRLVLTANQTNLSGWGVGTTPRYHPKFRQFIGIVFFESTQGHLLPWTTTKRGLDRESSIYLRTRGKMAVAAQPVLSYLTELYGADEEDGPEDREISGQVERVSVGAVTKSGKTVFKPPKRKKKTTTRIQYDAENEEIEIVRKHIRRAMAASRLGRHTFDYFLRMEGLD